MGIPKPIGKSSKVTPILVSKLESLTLLANFRRLGTRLQKLKTSEKGYLDYRTSLGGKGRLTNKAIN